MSDCEISKQAEHSDDEYEHYLNSQLKPCPFCGSPSLRVQQHPRHYYKVCCNECGGGSALYADEGRAVNGWNTRIEPPTEDKSDE